MDIGRTIRAARLDSGLSQAALAARAGTSQATVSDYEAGKKRPSVETLSRLLAAAGYRLQAFPRPRRVKAPTETELAQRGETLAQVISLAQSLPVRHDPVLRFPRLPAPREQR